MQFVHGSQTRGDIGFEGVGDMIDRLQWEPVTCTTFTYTCAPRMRR